MKPLESLFRHIPLRGRTVIVASTAICALLIAAFGVSNRPIASAVGEPAPAAAPAGGTDVRPFRVSIPDTALADLRQRITATRWPSKENVPDRSQGVQLARLQ